MPAWMMPDSLQLNYYRVGRIDQVLIGGGDGLILDLIIASFDN